MTERNWAGNLAYTGTVLAPTTLDELRAAILSAPGPLKALGTRHSFNDAADSPGTLLSTLELPEELEVDSARRVVRVSGGMRYGDLAPRLDAAGFALGAMASLPHISVAGAIATGTHGSGDAARSLSAATVAIEVMTASGEIVRFARGSDPEFAGAVVALGALGVVTAVELEIEPRYEMTQLVYEGLPLEVYRADPSAVTGLATSVSVFTSWRDPERAEQVWLKQRAGRDLPAEVRGARRAATPMHPVDGAADGPQTPQGVAGPWFERLPHFRLDATPSHGEELQSEFFVPRAQAGAALTAVGELAPRIAPLLLISELRTIAADDLWLSPASRGDVVAIHFTWRLDVPAVMALLPDLEAALSPFGAVPHWGKLFTVDAETLAARYPRADDFRALRSRLDPAGRFVTPYLRRVGLA